MPRFDTLLALLDWSPIRDCPGRFVLRPGHESMPPQQLAGAGATTRRLRSSHATDPIELVMIEEGAILSYRKPDGHYVHTLNTPEGLARKLAQLQAEDDIAPP